MDTLNVIASRCKRCCVARSYPVIARRGVVPTWQSSFCHAELGSASLAKDPEINSG
ncbi:hypothetical protein [Rickettsia endosymbiont of Orchestes rusci]|uniref:hypothetical protein n=1 Tax=Rickettsia endosymbiont of Orchestes rusci TaxID=3066250 RepID=UPI00313B6C63